MMNARERFRRIMHFQRPDRAPLWDLEGIAEAAVRQWVVNGEVPLGMARQDVVRYDPKTVIRLDTDPLPAFVPRLIEEDEHYRTETDRYGFTVRTLKDQSVGPTLYYYLSGPVSGRADWERMKARFDPDDPRRRPRSWGPELFEHYNGSDGPVGLRIDWGPGRGIKNGYMMGHDRFLTTLIDDPGLLEDMFAFWADFVIALLGQYLDRCRVDFVFFNEDGMAFKNSTLVSPETYRRIWGKPLRRVTEFIRARGIDVIGYNTSGNIRPLIPLLLELGVNLHMPLECAAGIDARDLRAEYGRDLLMIGNISRQALMDGPAAVEKEFHAKAPLMEAGGYVPAVDDLIMPDMPLASVRRYVELVREFRL